MTLLRRATPLLPPATAAAIFAFLPLVCLFWPNLAQASGALRPTDLGAVLWDGALCFGPLGVPLVGVGCVVVCLEQNG